MSINSVNIQNQNKYYNYQRNLNYNYQPSDNCYTSVASNPVLNQDIFEYSSNNTDINQRIANLKLQYQTLKDEQGIIGDCVDWFKNLFNTKNCSNNIEKAFNYLNENSTEEEIQAVEDKLGKYDSNQDSAVKGVASTGAMMTGGAIGAKLGATIGTAICPGLGTAGGFICGIIAGSVAGTLTSIGINQIENMTDDVKDNSWLNDENLLKEAGEGAIAGGSAVLMGGITQKVTGTVASKVGLTAAKCGGKTAMVALTEDGTAKVGSTIVKNALASAIGSGTAAATVSGGSYILECAIDKDKDFSLTDFGTTAATSFTFGGLIGGVTGGIQGYKGANGYNVHQAEIKAEAQARIQAEAEAKIRAQQAQERYNKPFEEKLSNKSAEESAKVFEENLPKYKSSFTDLNGNVLSKKQIQKRMYGLIEDIKKGVIDINELSDEQILDIWSWRMYDRPLNAYPEIQEAYIDRFNNICQSNHIIVNNNELIIRTVPVSPSRESEFVIGKPSQINVGEAWPAAAAKVSNDGEIISPGVRARIIDDKLSYLTKNNLDIITPDIAESTVYIVDVPENINLVGMDWSKTGPTEGILRSGFGSPAFRKEIDALGLSTEVNFSGNTKFRYNADASEVIEKIPTEVGEIIVKILHIIPI